MDQTRLVFLTCSFFFQKSIVNQKDWLLSKSIAENSFFSINFAASLSLLSLNFGVQLFTKITHVPMIIVISAFFSSSMQSWLLL